MAVFLPPRSSLYIAGVVVLLAATFLFVTFRLIIEPVLPAPQSADAVVVPAGGRGERLDKALEVMDTGIAPVLVLSMGGRVWSGVPPEVPGDTRAMCERTDLSYEVVCLWPSLLSTKGEAGIFSAIADERGWQSMVVVTSDYHVFRSMMLQRQCFEGEVYGVPAETKFRLHWVFHEWAGLFVQYFFDNACVGREKLDPKSWS